MNRKSENGEYFKSDVFISYYENLVKEKIYFQKKGYVMKGIMKVVKFYGGDGCVGHCRISRISQVDGSKK